MSVSKEALKAGISVVIPCLNEAETLHKCIEEAQNGIRTVGVVGEVLIADNGSTDGSQEIAIKAGARVVNVTEKGYGSALHEGILNAKYSVIVMGDADMSYPFDEIPNLTEPILKGDFDFILGSRLKGEIGKKAMPFLNRHIGTPFLSFLIRLIYGLKTSDCNSGMRSFRKTSYDLFKMQCPGMEYASEMLIKAAQTKVRYGETAIKFRKDQRTRAPHLRRWRDGWRHLRFVLGNAPSISFVILPAIIGGIMLTIALSLSLSEFFDSTMPMRYHTAFTLIAIAAPLLLLTNTFLLVKAVRHESGSTKSRLVRLLHQMSETAAAFYIAIGLYSLAGAEVLFLFFKWWQKGFGELFEPGSLIRISVITILATVIFAMDLGLGLIKLLPRKER